MLSWHKTGGLAKRGCHHEEIRIACRVGHCAALRHADAGANHAGPGHPGRGRDGRQRRHHRHGHQARTDAAGRADLGGGHQRRDDREGADPRPDRSPVGGSLAQGRRSSTPPARPTSSSAASATATATTASKARSACSSTASIARDPPRRWTTCPRSSASKCCAVRSRPCSARTCRRARSASSPSARRSSGAARPRSPSATTARCRPRRRSPARSATRLAFRLSGSLNERDGYFKNLTTGSAVNDRHRWSVRGDVLFEPSSDFSIRVIADYNLIKEVCCGVTSIFNGPATARRSRRLGFPVSDTTKVFDRNVIFNTDPYNRVLGKGISGQVDWNFGFAKLTSITAYRNQINQLRPGHRLHRRRYRQQQDGERRQDLHPGISPGLDRRWPAQLAGRRFLSG